MDDQRRSNPTEDDGTDPTEGVRIIGPDEAAEAMERGDVASRRTEDQPRFGDRPSAPPAGPRPALRFPLDASSDPTRIERPPVQPAPDPVTGPVELPHWTEPPTGEVPAVLIGDDQPLLGDDADDLDAWSSFATSAPRWRDADDDWANEEFIEHLAEDSDDVRLGALGDQDAAPRHEEYFSFDDLEERVEERTGDAAAEPAAANAGAPWASDAWHEGDDLEPEPVPVGVGGGGEADDDDLDGGATRVRTGGARSAAPSGAGPLAPVGGTRGRDMPMAIGVALGLVVVAAAALWIGPTTSMVLVFAVLAVAAVEYFNVLRKVGWEAATLLGVFACALFPLAVYWRGEGVLPLLGFIVVAAVLSWYLVGAGGPDPRVLEGSGATLLGVAWIGGLGSTAAAMLRMPDGVSMLLVAILLTAAYDVAALFVGSAMGHSPLSEASPNKTVEGLIGGMAAVVIVSLAVVGVIKIGPWTGPGAALLLGIGVAAAAPLGDLCQSLLKRDLGVKDMGTLLPGHGGVLDRFDSMLFVLPTVFWLTIAFG